ncbi:MAG: malto-oligosyltrehalose synthase, partial [Anaerolineae bacterium]|nr:malto-oligosyltrehalose synthase [Anaerolineae bacterium]
AAFLEDVRQFFPLVDYYGRLNSLAQTLLKLTAPGVPDIYQGTELWDFSLVDPDNRRPVDFEKRQQILNQEAVWSADFIESDAEGVSKAHMIKAVLNFRRQNPALFEKGTYEPLEVSDPQHLCAFARRWEGQEMVVIVPRLMATLMSGRQQMPVGEVVWGERQIQMPAGRYHHLFTGEVVEQTPLPVGTALRQFPLAVFIRE